MASRNGSAEKAADLAEQVNAGASRRRFGQLPRLRVDDLYVAATSVLEFLLASAGAGSFAA